MFNRKTEGFPVFIVLKQLSNPYNHDTLNMTQDILGKLNATFQNKNLKLSEDSEKLKRYRI